MTRPSAQAEGSAVVPEPPRFRKARGLDAHERDRYESRLRFLSERDPLTGVFNRREFELALERQLAYADRYEPGGAVLIVGIDNFKYLNNALGPRRGDQLIRAVAKRLESRLRDTDTLARLGGDEFAALLPRLSAEEATAVAQDLLLAVRKEMPAEHHGDATRLTVSIGVAAFRRGEHLSADDLLIEADVALIEAKERGRNRVACYDVADRARERRRARQSWSERIRDALADDRFTLYCQPIVDVNSRAVVSYELLLRMIGDDGEVIPAGEFIEHAERFGLIGEIDRWVVRRAVALLAQHAERGSGRPLLLAVNLAATSLEDAGLPGYVEQLTRSAGVDPASLIFEITETVAIANLDRARAFVERLKALGCRFALDDFGAGFATFHYLKHLSFDLLKIDGQFVRNLATNSTDQVVVRALVMTADGMGKGSVAEFVEDDATLEALRDLGVDYVQGFHIARPAPVSEVLGIDAADVARARLRRG